MVYIAHVHHAAATRIAAIQPFDSLPLRQRLLVQAKPSQYTEPGRLQEEAGAGRSWRRSLFEHAQPMTLFRQKQRRRLTGGAVTHDCDMPASMHGVGDQW
jgi:hypothetical protein